LRRNRIGGSDGTEITVVTGPARRPGRPKTKLTSAVEREMLVILRRQIAARIDEGAPTHTLCQLIRQFQSIDREIRAIDLRAAQEAEAAADAGDEADVPAGSDESAL
jgi:hypothetical protein